MSNLSNHNAAIVAASRSVVEANVARLAEALHDSLGARARVDGARGFLIDDIADFLRAVPANIGRDGADELLSRKLASLNLQRADYVAIGDNIKPVFSDVLGREFGDVWAAWIDTYWALARPLSAAADAGAGQRLAA